MAADFEVTGSADLKQLIASFKLAEQAVSSLKGDLIKAGTSMGKTAGEASKNAAAMKRTLDVYGKFSKVAGEVARSQKNGAASAAAQKQNIDALTKSMGALASATKAVQGTNEAEFKSKSRTIALMDQQVKLSKAVADAKYAEARAAAIAQKAQEQSETAAARAAERAERATRKDARNAKTNAWLNEPVKNTHIVAENNVREHTNKILKEKIGLLKANAWLDAKVPTIYQREQNTLENNNRLLRERAKLMQLRTVQTPIANIKNADTSSLPISPTARYNAILKESEQNVFANRFALHELARAYTVAATAATAFGVGAVAVAANFEQSFAELKVSIGSGQLGDNINELKQEFIDLSKVVPLSFEELTKIASAGAQMGLAQDQLGDFTKTVAMFASQSDVSSEEAAKLFGRIMNLANVPTERLEDFASTVAYLGRSSAATEAEILKVTQSISATLTESGFAEDHIVGLSTALASLGVPPEWARGALQRILAGISRNADEGAAGMERYGKIMGMAADESLSLYRSDPTAFFVQLAAGIDKTTASGQSFTSVMNELGVRNTRDVQLLQRLASNHELLANYIGMSVDEYAKGNYLQDNFNILANTTVAQLKELWNAFLAAAEAAGEKLLPAVNFLITGLKTLLDFLGPFLSVLGPIAAGLSGIIGPMLAFKAASLVARAALDSWKSLQGQTTSAVKATGDTIAAQRRNIIDYARSIGSARMMSEAYARTQQKMAAAQKAAASGAGQFSPTIRTQGQAAAIAKYAGTLKTLQTASQAGATSMQKFSGMLATVPTYASRAASAVGGFVKSIGSGLALGAAMFIVGSIIDAISSAANKAAEAQKRINGMTDAMYAAGGGSESLQAAVTKDTAAFAAAGYQADKTSGIYATVTRNYLEAANGVTNMTVNYNDLETGISKASKSTQLYGVDVSNANTEVGKMGGIVGALAPVLGLTTKYIDEETIALGENVEAWKNKALTDFVMEMSAEDINKYAEAGVDLGRVLSEGIKNGAGGSAAVIDEQISKIKSEVKKMADDGSNFTDVTKYNELVSQLGALEELKSSFAGLDTRIMAVATAMKEVAIAGGDVATASAQLKGLGGFGDLIDVEVLDDGTIAMDNLATQIEEVYNAAFKLVDIAGATAAALEALGQSIVENGGGFDVMTENGRANMEALKEVVSSYAAEIAQEIENGMNPADAAALMQAKMADLFDQLSSMGVDTSQLDWLMDYVNQFVTTEYGAEITIGADATPAYNTADAIVNGINNSEARVLVTANINDALAKLDLLRQLAQQIGNWLPGFEAALGRMHSQIARPKSSGAPSNSPWSSVNSNKRATREAEKSVGRKPNIKSSASSLGAGAAKGYDNQAKAAQQAAKAAQDAGRKQQQAAQDAARAIEEQNRLLQELGNYYKNLAGNMMGGIIAEGNAFKALQEMGAAIAENGKNFNTFTEGGRANFQALVEVFDSFGATLEGDVKRGVLSQGDAMNRYREFASGVYSELVRLGVPAGQISSFFNALGVSASGWNTQSQAVKQFAEVLTDAHAAASGIAGGIDSIIASLKEAEDWAKILGDRLDATYNKLFGQQNAQDAALSAIYDMRDAYQDVLDKLRDLREEQQKLNADLASAQSDKNKAELEAAISDKYGETDRAQEYRAQAQEAGSRVSSIEGDLAVNAKDIASIEMYTGVLEGSEKEVISNRKALLEFQKSLLDSIKSYAAAGATTEEVNNYTAKLRREFVNTAVASGYSEQAIASYTAAFDQYVDVVKATPKTVVTTATANVDPAKAALNTIPRFASHVTTAQADTGRAIWELNQIPKAQTSAVYSYNDPGSYHGAWNGLNALAGGRSAGVYPYVDPDAWKRAYNSLASLVNVGASAVGAGLRRNEGGIIPGFAGGGKIPGSPPSNKRVDNLMAKVDSRGMVQVRSGEWVHQEPAVKFYGEETMHKMNNMQIPKEAFNTGGQVGNSVGRVSSSGTAASAIVELSPTDRALIADLKQMTVALYANDKEIASSANRGNKIAARRGGDNV